MTDPITPPDRACRAVVEFMKDWNTLPPEDCAWRMFHRLKTELAEIERQSMSANAY